MRKISLITVIACTTLVTSIPEAWAVRPVVLATDVNCPAGTSLEFLSLDANGKAVKGMSVGRYSKIAFLGHVLPTAIKFTYFFTNTPVDTFTPAVAKSRDGQCIINESPTGVDDCTLNRPTSTTGNLVLVGGQYINIRVTCHGTNTGPFSLEFLPIR